MFQFDGKISKVLNFDGSNKIPFFEVNLHKNLRLVTNDKCLVERRLTAT